eukprot:5503903-Pleurochrysis_carterae.AAC.1
MAAGSREALSKYVQQSEGAGRAAAGQRSKNRLNARGLSEKEWDWRKGGSERFEKELGNRGGKGEVW